jgi:hypothetical protein
MTKPFETNNIADAPYSAKDLDHGHVVQLNDPNLVRIDRLRLLSDPGTDYPFYDLSYCWGTLKDGKHVRVQLPVERFPRRGLNAAIVKMCRDAGVFGKGLGLFDGRTISVCI